MFQELSKNEQDLMIVNHLQAHKELPELYSAYGKFTERGSSRQKLNEANQNRERILYYFAKLPVCRKFLFMVYSLGIKRYKNIIKHYDSQKIQLREHKSKGKIPKNINELSADDVARVVCFIKQYAEKYALPLPGRVANFKNYRVVLLPSIMSKITSQV